jgi:hypothetical protein
MPPKARSPQTPRFHAAGALTVDVVLFLKPGTELAIRWDQRGVIYFDGFGDDPNDIVLGFPD